MKNIFERNKNKFIDYIKKDKNIVAVFLFGSYTDNSYNEDSDIDIALIYKSKINMFDTSRI
ncbi:MAG: nucleotidyltransferase domain-containing protein [Clostridia bacterium]